MLVARDLTSMLVSTPCLVFFSVVARAMTWGAQQKPCCTPRTTTGTPSLQTSWKILRSSRCAAQPTDKAVLPGIWCCREGPEITLNDCSRALVPC